MTDKSSSSNSISRHPTAVDGTKANPVVISTEVDSVDTDERVCVICLEKRPDTLVLPCMCNVVCRTCAPTLKGTSNEKRCVVCREPITSVLMDGQ